MSTAISTETRDDMEQEEVDRDAMDGREDRDPEESKDVDLAGTNLLNSSLAFLFERREDKRRKGTAGII